MINLISKIPYIIMMLSIPSTWYIASNYYTNKFDKIIVQSNLDNQLIINDLTKQRIEKERELNKLITKLDLDNRENQNEINKNQLNNIDILNRMLNENNNKSNNIGHTDSNKSACVSANKTTKAFISRESGEFLIRIAKEADEAANYATTCYRWVKSLKLEDGYYE